MARAALLLVLVLGMCSCVRGRRGRSLAAAPAPKELHIVHINDVHNRIEQTSTSSTTCSDAQAASGLCLGGWGRISSYVNAARKKAAAAKAAFLFLDAGDQFDGTLWDVVYKGAATAKMQNIVKPDVMTIGNHEFTFPPDILKAYIGNITFPMLGACNTDTSDEPLLKGLIQKWKVWQFGPYKVAAVGWLTPDASFTAANIGKVKVTPVNAAVKQCIADLKKAHPDVHLIIGMSHTGYHPDIETAKQVPDLDIIISGHSHTFLRTPSKVGPIFDKTVNATDETCLKKRACDEPGGPYPTYVSSQKCSGVGAAKTCTNKTIPVVQVYYASKYIGDVTLDLATKKVTAAKPVLLGGDNSTSPWPQDPVILAEIEKLSGPVTALEKKPAGKTSVVMIGGRPGRVAETNFGSYLADIMVNHVKSLPHFVQKNGPVTIALINSGSIRANIEPELVNYGDVLTALPFRNLLAVKVLTGAQLRKVLTRSVSGISEGEGYFMQVAGVRVFHQGNDLVDAKIILANGSSADIDPKAKYNVATLDYISNGGDGFFDFKEAPSLLLNGNEVGDIMMHDLEKAMPNPIKVPDVTKTRRIINCAADYVSCANPLYAPCCKSKQGASKAAPSPSPKPSARR